MRTEDNPRRHSGRDHGSLFGVAAWFRLASHYEMELQCRVAERPTAKRSPENHSEVEVLRENPWFSANRCSIKSSSYAGDDAPERDGTRP
jgi:hypothetical protein